MKSIDESKLIVPTAEELVDINNLYQKPPKLISSYEEMGRIVRAHKELGKLIIFLSGTFDLIHVGHKRYFRTAIWLLCKRMGKTKNDFILIVGVDNDAEVRKRKGELRPVVIQDERAEMLDGLEDVTYVVIKEEEEFGWKLGELLEPDFLILSESTNFLNEDSREAMLQKLGLWAKRIVILPPQAETSTTGKIHKLHTQTIGDLESTIIPALEKQFGSTIDGLRQILKEFRGGG